MQTPTASFSQICGQLFGYSDFSRDERRVDLLVRPPYHPQYPEESAPSFLLLRKDMRHPHEWDEMDGRSLIEGLVVPQSTLRLLRADGKGYMDDGHPARQWPRLMDVTVSRLPDGSGGGGTRQPQMERVLPGIPHPNSRNFRR